MTSSPEANHPYVPPRGPQPGIDTQVVGNLPRYTKTMAIVDLVCCGVRGIGFLVFVANYFAPGAHQGPVTGTVLAGMAVMLCIATFGILGDILILLGKPAGLWIGAAAVAATIVSTAMGVWQTSVQAEQFAPAGLGRTVYLVVIGFVTLARLGLLGLYVGARVQFANWTRRHVPNSAAF